MALPQTEEELTAFVNSILDADPRIQSVSQSTEGDYENSIVRRNGVGMIQLRRLEITGGEGEPTALVLDKDGLHVL